MATLINNGVDSRYFLIKIVGTTITTEDKESLMAWFLSCLSTIDDPSIYTNFNDDYSFEVLPNYCECEEFENTLTIAVYLRWRLKQVFDSTDMIIVDENMEETKLPITKLQNAMTSIPEIVSAIGISGLSRSVFKRKWWKLLDSANGYLWYNSYHRLTTGEWEAQMDRSNVYKWDDFSYPINGN